LFGVLGVGDAIKIYSSSRGRKERLRGLWGLENEKAIVSVSCLSEAHALVGVKKGNRTSERVVEESDINLVPQMFPVYVPR
jgi:hypothetical protein